MQTREDADCHMRPREARECARHILFIQWKIPNVPGVFLAFLTEGREKLFGAKVNKSRKTIIITISILKRKDVYDVKK